MLVVLIFSCVGRVGLVRLGNIFHVCLFRLAHSFVSHLTDSRFFALAHFPHCLNSRKLHCGKVFWHQSEQVQSTQSDFSDFSVRAYPSPSLQLTACRADIFTNFTVDRHRFTSLPPCLPFPVLLFAGLCVCLDGC